MDGTAHRDEFRPSASAAWPRRHPSRRRNGWGSAYAALDLGTNNCRLLIARPDSHGFRVVDAFSRIVRLGEGLALTRALSDHAMVRTIEALKVCRDKMDARRVARARLVTTEACRAAVNGSDFLNRVETETGLRFEILARGDEAELAAAGCASLADSEARSIVLFDIGGGSTEIVWLAAAEAGASRIRDRIKSWISLPIGVVTMAERHGKTHVSIADFEAMVAEVQTRLGDFAATVGAAPHAPLFHLLGTSGTVTTIAGIHLGLPRYDRRRVDGLWMARSDVDFVIGQLLRMAPEERSSNGCIGTERSDLVLPGCAIFEAIRRTFPSERVRIADRGLREGILMEMMMADGVWRGRHL